MNILPQDCMRTLRSDLQEKDMPWYHLLGMPDA